MDSVGVHSLGSAAAQGGQDTYNEYANGSPFTGWSSDVQALDTGRAPSLSDHSHNHSELYSPHLVTARGVR